jgi:aminoglycoside phosphotransferase family enzyme/predicted kinase
MSNNQLIENLLNPAAYDHIVEHVKHIDTHVSWVMLTGQYAYKIKKPVDFEFLNYSTLEKRKFYCEEEVRLNQPFAPELYLGVVAITGDEENPQINGDGKIIDYAVKMREFPQDNLFSEVLARQQLTPLLIEQLAKLIVDFHQKTTVSTDPVFGTPEHVHAPVIQNFDQIADFLTEESDRKQMQRLRQWSEHQFKQHYDLLAARKAQGFIRECHGDLHLKNIILFDGKPLLFDRIEFNDDFRWTDVMADVGFLAMDLDDNNQTSYARHFLNHYFSYSGDYAGLALLPYYQAYRAIVRAKVALFSLYSAPDQTEKQACWQRYRRFMTLAEQYTQAATPTLFITHGLTGAGKSTVASELVAALGAIQIRSDVERKRLLDLAPAAKTNSALLQGIYRPEITTTTYDHLAKLAQIIIQAGYSVIVDATFLQQAQREQFHQLAKKLNTCFVILHCYAEREQMVQWLNKRAAKQHEPSEAGLEVLTLLENSQEKLTVEEQQFAVVVNAAKINLAVSITEIKRLLAN